MLEASIVASRFAQYLGAAVLFGSSLFFIYALPGSGCGSASANPWAKRLMAASSLLLLVGAIAGLITQTGMLAGSFSEGMKPTNLHAVITQMNFGRSALLRAAIATVLLISTFAQKPSVALWAICVTGGIVACASFAWMGHGAAMEGTAGYIHLLADIAHSLAAAIWVGALVSFMLLVLTRDHSNSENDRVFYHALHGFSGIGSVVVAVLVVTGLINSWFLVGPNRITDFWALPYGQVLLAKITMFIGMLGFAALNRYRLTPRLDRDLTGVAPLLATVSALQRSLLCESAAAFVVLGLVAWLGMLTPASAQ